mgnify:FL=1
MILSFIGGVVALISVITFIIGVLMQFSDKFKLQGLQMLLYSIVAFVIGFGTCVATLSLN